MQSIYAVVGEGKGRRAAPSPAISSCDHIFLRNTQRRVNVVNYELVKHSDIYLFPRVIFLPGPLVDFIKIQTCLSRTWGTRLRQCITRGSYRQVHSKWLISYLPMLSLPRSYGSVSVSSWTACLAASAGKRKSSFNCLDEGHGGCTPPSRLSLVTCGSDGSKDHVDWMGKRRELMLRTWKRREVVVTLWCQRIHLSSTFSSFIRVSHFSSFVQPILLSSFNVNIS